MNVQASGSHHLFLSDEPPHRRLRQRQPRDLPQVSPGVCAIASLTSPAVVGSLPGVIEEHAIAGGSQVVALTFTGRRLSS